MDNQFLWLTDSMVLFKCDEGKPLCGRCRDAHVACSYLRSDTVLRSSHEETVSLIDGLGQLRSNIVTVINQRPNHDKAGFPPLGHLDLEYLQCFHHLTMQTLGPSESRQVFKAEFEKHAVEVEYHQSVR